jgi:hypothetical protein
MQDADCLVGRMPQVSVMSIPRPAPGVSLNPRILLGGPRPGQIGLVTLISGIRPSSGNSQIQWNWLNWQQGGRAGESVETPGSPYSMARYCAVADRLAKQWNDSLGRRSSSKLRGSGESLGGNVVQARRAKVRPVRVIIALAVAAAVLVGGAFAAWKFWPNTTTAGPQAESSTLAVESQAPSTAESSPSPSETPSTDAASTAAAEALEACQATVRAADDVLKQGKTGVSHWIAHVRVQTDDLAGKLTTAERKERFAKTRVKGPGDLRRYNDALSAYEDLEGSCGKVQGADSVVAATLKKCNERSKAQQPVLKATAGGMKDWKAHIKFMQFNKEHPDPDAAGARQSTWMKQYRAAPKNINAFKKAVKNFDAPSC